MFNLFSNAIKTVQSFLAPKPPAQKSTAVVVKPPTRPANTFQKFEPLVSYAPYIAKWGDSKATITAGQARNNQNFAAVQAQQKKQQEEADRAAAAKRQYEAQVKFDKTKNEFAAKARQSAANVKKAQQGNFWSWVTGGFVGENNARDFAQKQLEELEKNQTKRYDDKLNKFLKEQAKRKAEIEKKRFSTQEEFDQAVGIFSKWEAENIDSLEYMRASSAGLAEGFGKVSQSEGDSLIAKVGSWAKKNIADGLPGQVAGGIWKYTLGSGDENLPSLVTAPSRAVNFVGNSLWNKGGNKNLHDGKVVQGIEKGKNPWTQTYDQRNFNMPQPKKYSDTDFEKWYKTRDLGQWKGDIKSGRIKEKDVKELFRRQFRAQTENDKWANYTTEFFADPLFGVGKAGKGVGLFGDALKSTKVGKFFSSTAKKATESKPFKWATAEYKTPDQKFGDALKQAKLNTDQLQKELLPRINEINSKISKNDRIDASIIDEIASLTDNEAAILQRMRNGKFGTMRDRLAMQDIKGLQYSAPTREKLQDLSRRWDEFAEKMRFADDVRLSHYGKGKKQPYFARIDYSGEHSLDNYNFYAPKARRKSKFVQPVSDLVRDQKDRYMLSNLGAQTSDDFRFLSRRRQELQSQYRDRFRDIISPVQEANRKRGTLGRYFSQRFKKEKPTTGFGRSLFNTTRKTLALPNKVWKKSVLTYRPAWTVNNVLYNTQAAMLSGGVRALPEQLRLLRPKNWKQAMNDVPAAVKADLTGDLGTVSYKGRNPFKKVDSKLNDFYGGVENWSRVAAFRAAKAKGMTDEQALKRVNKYLFNYKTANWERPLKTVLPFWAWNKGLTKAAVNMPADRPFAAKLYNSVDRYQQSQFDQEFEAIVPELTRMGYSEQEIQDIKEEQARYFRGRLKVGNQWITTPFNAFSEKGLTGFGVNPYLAATVESATATDSFGRKINGTDAQWQNRVMSKFPQYELGKKGVSAWRVATGADKPRKGWIGEAGSQGYGLTKERQGFDSKKTSYDRSLDPRAKLGQDALAFVGVPRGLEFDKDYLLKTKRLAKATEEYFALDGKNLDFPTADAKRKEIFKKYGMTEDDFYKGVLAKYDTENTTRIKSQKEEAKNANRSLYDQYAAQPEGTRNMWATQKLRELNSIGYFDKNPFLRSFDWVNPTTVAKADRQSLYLESKASGDWSKWRAKYGDTRKVSQKKIDYDKAKITGDWTAYHQKYGVTQKQTPFRFDGKYFKSAASMERYKSGQFWSKYARASKDDRRQLLKDNPQYNLRGNWTDAMWDAWKSDRKKKQIALARGFGNFAKLNDDARTAAQSKAQQFSTVQFASKKNKVVWR